MRHAIRGPALLLGALATAGAAQSPPRGSVSQNGKPATAPAAKVRGGEAPKSAARQAAEDAVAPYEWKAKDGSPAWVAEVVKRHKFYRLASAGSVADIRARIDAAKVAKIVPRPRKFDPRQPNIYGTWLGTDAKYTAIYPTKDEQARVVRELEKDVAELAKTAERLGNPKLQPGTPPNEEPIGQFLEPVEPGK